MALTPEQLKKAQDYNPRLDGQRWTRASLPDEALRALAVVSAEFAERVAVLQAEEELHVDGMLGPRTLQALIERQVEAEVTAEQATAVDLGWWKTGDPWPEAAAIATVEPPLQSEPLDAYLDRVGVPHWSAYELTRLHRWGRNVEPVREDWSNIVPTARLAEILRHELGSDPLVTVAGYRPRRYNRAVGGAKNSQHMRFRALLLVLDADDSPREDEQRRLYEVSARLFARYGKDLKMGLGFYTADRGPRVSIDTGFGMRTWQRDYVQRVLADLKLTPPA
jgi:hypothetical protein